MTGEGVGRRPEQPKFGVLAQLLRPGKVEQARREYQEALNGYRQAVSEENARLRQKLNQQDAARQEQIRQVNAQFEKNKWKLGGSTIKPTSEEELCRQVEKGEMDPWKAAETWKLQHPGQGLPWRLNHFIKTRQGLTSKAAADFGIREFEKGNELATNRVERKKRQKRWPF